MDKLTYGNVAIDFSKKQEETFSMRLNIGYLLWRTNCLRLYVDKYFMSAKNKA